MLANTEIRIVAVHRNSMLYGTLPCYYDQSSLLLCNVAIRRLPDYADKSHPYIAAVSFRMQSAKVLKDDNLLTSVSIVICKPKGDYVVS